MANAQRLKIRWTGGEAVDWLLLIVLAIIWGSSYVLIKKAILTYKPIEVAQLRMLLSGVFLLPFFPRAIKRVPRSKIPAIAVVGLVGSGIPAFLYPVAQQKIDSAVMGIINSTVPLFTFLIGLAFFKLIFNRIKALGIAIGLAGAMVLVFVRSDGGFSADYAFALLGIAATICYGLSTNIIKSRLNEIDSLSLTSVVYLITAVVAMVSFSFNGASVIEATGSQPIGFLYMVLLSLLGTAVAMILFNRLVQRTDALFAATVTYLMPIVSIFWGVIDGEQLGWWVFLGMFLILAGVFITNRLSMPQKFNK
jgi:drug/metabolite transporter (DMT)-like permease